MGDTLSDLSGPTPALRIFVALTLPEVHRRLLHHLAEDRPGLAWTPLEQLHVTLRFLGDVAPARMEPLAAALERIQIMPFLLPLENMGVFPPHGLPKVVWIGLGQGHPALSQLRQRLDDTLLACGLDLDLRHFHPHVTLARVRSAAAAESARHFAKRHREFAGPPFKVEGFSLFASALHPEGARHEELHRFPLRPQSPKVG
ncbi:MAG: RNA 2',3'-cyclic phosphodiesterase [Opitutales bacterium]